MCKQRGRAQGKRDHRVNHEARRTGYQIRHGNKIPIIKGKGWACCG